MELNELQQRVGSWHQVTFGDQIGIEDLVLEKLREETQELIYAHDNESTHYNELCIPMECADVAIALLAYCSRRGIDLQHAIHVKMVINKERKWKKTDKGFERDKNPE